MEIFEESSSGRAIERLVIRGERHLESLPNGVIRNVLTGLTLARHGNKVQKILQARR